MPILLWIVYPYVMWSVFLEPVEMMPPEIGDDPVVLDLEFRPSQRGRIG